MDKNINLLSSVQQMKKSAKKTNNNTTKASKKSKPVKVVYISNPVKIKTSASQFRALVQELTGRDSQFPDPAKFPAEAGGGDQTAKISGGDLDDGHDHDLEVVATEQPSESTNSSATTTTTTTTTSTNSSANQYDMFVDDDVFMPQMMEGFSGMLSPSSVWYDTHHHQVV